jgi:hypothetical protein
MSILERTATGATSLRRALLPEPSRSLPNSLPTDFVGAGNETAGTADIFWKIWSEREDLNLRPLVSQTRVTR